MGSLHGSEGSRMNRNKSNRGERREKRRLERNLRQLSQGTARVGSQTPDLRNDGCKLSRHRRQAVEGQSPSTGPAASLSALGDPFDGPRRSHSPLNTSDRVVPSALTILLSVRKPGSRVPRSRSEMWTSWTPECSARSICRQPLARRSFRMRSPVAAQMSFAMRPCSA